MKTVTVISNQSLFDLAVQEFGRAEACLDIAVANEMDVTDILTPGMKLLIPEAEIDRDVVRYFRRRRQHITTADTVFDMKFDVNIDVGNGSTEESDFWALPGMLPYMLS